MVSYKQSIYVKWTTCTKIKLQFPLGSLSCWSFTSMSSVFFCWGEHFILHCVTDPSPRVLQMISSTALAMVWATNETWTGGDCWFTSPEVPVAGNVLHSEISGGMLHAICTRYIAVPYLQALILSQPVSGLVDDWSYIATWQRQTIIIYFWGLLMLIFKAFFQLMILLA